MCGLTISDLLGEILEERGGGLDVVKLEYALEDLWDWVRECKVHGTRRCTYDLVFLGVPLDHDDGGCESR
jgi:hypothetical protein